MVPNASQTSPRRGAATDEDAALVIGLTAVIFAADADRAAVLVVDAPGQPASALPFGPFDPLIDRTFELALRAFVRAQTGFELGYVEQLYTFGDRGREAPRAEVGAPAARVISVGYLAIAPSLQDAPSGRWADWYGFFPWEDWRAGPPDIIAQIIEPGLRAWSDEAGGQGRRAARWERARTVFGFGGAPWNEERVLDRYELLYEAGLVAEAAIDAGAPAASGGADTLGARLVSDHRRILATAIQRLRGKLKYRPVVFELMPETFTLSTLQAVAEVVLGHRLHKQNFRRALTAGDLVAGTGVMETATGGRPAELFCFRRDAATERPTLGIPTPKLKDS